MSQPKKLEDLSKDEFAKLKFLGVLNSIYPDAPSSYEELHPLKRPQPLENPDFRLLVETAEGYIHTLERGGYVDSDDEHYIFEAAMEAVYGKDVWKYINKKLK